MVRYTPHLGRNSLGTRLETESEKVIDPGGEYGESDTCGETDNNGIRDKLMTVPRRNTPRATSMSPAMKVATASPFETEIGYNIIDNHNERTRSGRLSAPSIRRLPTR